MENGEFKVACRTRGKYKAVTVTQNKRLQVVKHAPTATENAKQMACHCQPS